ncbi:hypothetical protein ACSF6V_15860 [Escherichia coli]|uniref:hypothetical protein n=1 Tax=Escherichia coli TaxID=562 RepID=UPI003EE96F3B
MIVMVSAPHHHHLAWLKGMEGTVEQTRPSISSSCCHHRWKLFEYVMNKIKLVINGLMVMQLQVHYLMDWLFQCILAHQRAPRLGASTPGRFSCASHSVFFITVSLSSSSSTTCPGGGATPSFLILNEEEVDSGNWNEDDADQGKSGSGHTKVMWLFTTIVMPSPI